MKSDKMHRQVLKQLKHFTLVGPFFAPEGKGNWVPRSLDGATVIPSNFRTGGKEIPVSQVVFSGKILDLEQHIGAIVSRDVYGIRNQGFLFCKFETPAAGTLNVAYSGARSAWWVDGREVYDTRSHNGDNVPAPHFYHQFKVALEKGAHVLCVRLVSDWVDWKLFLLNLEWHSGTDDVVRIDRGAGWRDYRKSLVRVEERPLPSGTIHGVPRDVYEDNLARQGVDARWLSVVDDEGSAVFKSRHLPAGAKARPEYERQLQEWVQLLHRKNISVMSWYPLHLNRAAWAKHPDWRQRYLLASPGIRCLKLTCCINSPYGDALIDFIIEALKKFDLDGFWFDGSSFSPIWQLPQPVSCICRHCRAKFKHATGLDLPASFDWNLPEFRRWVQWRFDMHAGYWQRLVDAVHKAVPQAALVFNHYHREDIGWNTAIPLAPFGKGFISGIEADYEPLRGAFYTRLMRAYGRPDTEVWMAMGTGRTAKKNATTVMFNPRKVLDFAVACATAGGNCSVGGVDLGVEGPTVGMMAMELKPRAPYLNLPAIPQMALHVSQQTETFVFGRNPGFTGLALWQDYAWNSLVGWHHLMAFAGRTCDVVFDAHLEEKTLAKYPVLVMPMAVALGRAQLDNILAYVRAGGTLLTGPWFGLRDEWGEAGEGYPLADRSIFPFGQEFPEWKDFEQRPKLTFSLKGAAPVRASALADWSLKARRFNMELAANNPAFARSRFGQGRIVQSAFDWGTLFRYSGAAAVVKAFRAFYAALGTPLPLVELVNDTGDLILGVFRKDRNTVVVHIQHFQPPWESRSAQDSLPLTRAPVTLRWNGRPPASVRLVLPEPGQAVAPFRQGSSTVIVVPPFIRGQIVEIME